jgi:hypothetical protein
MTRPATIAGLPDGVMIRSGGAVGLLLGGSVLPWSFSGYGAPIAVSPTLSVEVLTPPSSVAALAAGYRPMIHPSAAAPGA